MLSLVNDGVANRVCYFKILMRDLGIWSQSCQVRQHAGFPGVLIGVHQVGVLGSQAPSSLNPKP